MAPPVPLFANGRWVPISASSWHAMGLASTDMSHWKVLTDIQDLEDGLGGMDFKILVPAKD